MRELIRRPVEHAEDGRNQGSQGSDGVETPQVFSFQNVITFLAEESHRKVKESVAKLLILTSLP